MSKPTQESLKEAPPKLRQLLARYDNDYGKVSKVLDISTSFLGALVHKRRNLGGKTLAKLEMALGERDTPPKKVDGRRAAGVPHGGPRKPTPPGHPLLAEAFAKYKSWSAVGRALGYTGTGPMYVWNANPDRFDEAAQQRIRDLLDGKVTLRTPQPRGKQRLDAGELGIAIVVSEDAILERVLDVAQAMNALSLFQKRLTPSTWLVIYRFTGETARDDMESFRLWAGAGNRAEVVTP